MYKLSKWVHHSWVTSPAAQVPTNVLPCRHLVCTVRQTPPPHPPPLLLHCWWRLQTHPALCPADHNCPSRGSTPNRNPHIYFQCRTLFDLFHKETSRLCVWIFYGLQQMCTTNLEFPLKNHFLLQSLLLQGFGPDFQLQALVLLAPESFWLTLEEMLHKGQLRPEDLQEPLNRQEGRFMREVKWGNYKGATRVKRGMKQAMWLKSKNVNVKSYHWLFEVISGMSVSLKNHQEACTHSWESDWRKLLWDTWCLPRTAWSWLRLWTRLICFSFIPSSPRSSRWVIPWSKEQDACCSLAFSPGLSLTCRPRTHCWETQRRPDPESGSQSKYK